MGDILQLFEDDLQGLDKDIQEIRAFLNEESTATPDDAHSERGHKASRSVLPNGVIEYSTLGGVD